jgi:ubiquinone/menaquinone biosynthesis C-methylase UbiE
VEGSGRHERVRRSYDAIAAKYADAYSGELAGKPLDRALLACLIEQADQGAPIADIGCGPGHVAAWIASHGRAAVGIDLSAGMVAAGRQAYPGTEFREGDFLDLPARDGEFGAVVTFYSVIHLAPGELVPAFREIWRVLRPGGMVLVSFHVGSEVRHLEQWWGQAVDVDFRFLEVADVAQVMEGTGFSVEVRLERASYAEEVDTRRGYLLGRRRN